jgi:hypothetical protein
VAKKIAHSARQSEGQESLYNASRGAESMNLGILRGALNSSHQLINPSLITPLLISHSAGAHGV